MATSLLKASKIWSRCYRLRACLRAAAASRGWATAGWATASFEMERARCLRRAQPARLEEAQAALRVALGIFPNYLEALLEQVR